MPRILSVFAVALTLALLFPVLTVEAQYRSRYSQEGSGDSEAREEAASRRGVSSATRKAIDSLGDDPVKEFPIPVLLGVSLRQVYSDFGDPRSDGSRSHEGQDILAPRGSYIVSPTEAVVIRTGTGSSAGKYVYTANPGDETFVYMHLDDIADGIKAGTKLKKGDLIGYVGDTGNAKGGVTHLHFEVREGRKALDPYPRLSGEFTLKERIAAITDILEDSDDEEDEAEALVKGYRALFIAAVADGIELPDAIEDAMPAAVAGGTAGFARDLDLRSSGEDVAALQTFLIAQKAGSSAKTLAETGATGYFGALTQAALAEYQAKEGITPSVGYFGAKTRAYIAAKL